VLAVIVLSISALACSLGGAAKAPESATPTAAKSGAAATSAPSSGGDQSLSLTDRQTGLDKLKSYRMNWQAEWKSTESGNTESAAWNWVEEFSSNPQALHWTWQLTDSKDASKNSSMEWWQIADTTYMLTKDASGKGQCMSFSSADQKNQLTKGLFNPGSLGSVSNAKLAGTDTVNGIKTKHYKYDEKSAVLFAGAKVNGDIWVATDGDYVVKETVNWSGAGGLFGAGSSAKGDGKWTWEITDVNQPITIKAPDNCGGAASDIPVMKDATEQNRIGDMLMYKTPTKLADVVKFYQTQMPAAGWQPAGEPQITDEYAQLEFTKGDQKAQVMLTVEQDTTQVVVNVTK
jgi:hypothetical protein